MLLSSILLGSSLLSLTQASHPQLEKLWEAPLGPGFSSPALDVRANGEGHDRLVVSHRDGERMMLGAYARESGALLWSTGVPDTPHAGQEDYGGGRGPHATPLVHGGAVFAIGYGGTLVCLDVRTGNERWSHDLVADLGAKPVQFGFAAAPVAEGKRLYVMTGGEAGLTAFDTESGEVLWRSTVLAASYVTPVLARFAGTYQLIALFEDETVGFDPEAGGELWRMPHVRPGLTNYAMLSVLDADAGGAVFVSGQGNLGTRRIDVRKDGETWASEVRWHARGVKLSHGRVVLQDGFLYGSNGSMLCALRLADGVVAFKERGFGEHTLIAAGERNLLLDEQGRLSFLELAPERVDVFDLGEALEPKTWASPLFHGGVIYARDAKRLVARCFRNAAFSEPTRTIDTGYEPERIEVAPALLAFAVGRYRGAQGQVLDVELRDGSLWVTTSKGSCRLGPRSDRIFEGAEGERLEWIREESPVPSACLWGHGEERLRAERQPIRVVDPDEGLRRAFLGSWVAGDVAFEIVEGNAEDGGGWQATSRAYPGVVFSIEMEQDRLWLRAREAPYGIPPVLAERSGDELLLHQGSDTHRARRR